MYGNLEYKDMVENEINVGFIRQSVTYYNDGWVLTIIFSRIPHNIIKDVRIFSNGIECSWVRLKPHRFEIGFNGNIKEFISIYRCKHHGRFTKVIAKISGIKRVFALDLFDNVNTIFPYNNIPISKNKKRLRNIFGGI